MLFNEHLAPRVSRFESFMRGAEETPPGFDMALFQLVFFPL
jgi:hypothetical protein